jgi:DUF4097 and DUF4098 domain-containing protein YvlB
VIEKTFPVAGQPEIDVRIQAGRVEVLPGEPGRIDVKVDTSDKNFIVEQQGDTVEVHSDRDARWLFASSAKVFITMPLGGRATIRTASADVDIQVPMAKAAVDSASGDVRITESDKAAIKTASGNINVDKIGIVLKAKSASGDVSVGEAGGTVELATASGNVRVGRSDATIEVNTASGRITIEHYTGSEVTTKSMSGNVEIGMESGTKVDLDASLLSGKVKWPPKPAQPSEVKREMTLRAKSVSGDLVINRVE